MFILLNYIYNLDKQVYESNIDSRCKFNVSQNAMTSVGIGLFTLTNTQVINQYNIVQIEDLSKDNDLQIKYNDNETLISVVEGILKLNL